MRSRVAMQDRSTMPLAFQICVALGRSLSFCLRMDALQEPIRRQLTADPFSLSFAIDSRADGRELQADADVVEETSRLLRIGAPLGFACHQFFERRRG